MNITSKSYFSDEVVGEFRASHELSDKIASKKALTPTSNRFTLTYPGLRLKLQPELINHIFKIVYQLYRHDIMRGNQNHLSKCVSSKALDPTNHLLSLVYYKLNNDLPKELIYYIFGKIHHLHYKELTKLIGF